MIFILLFSCEKEKAVQLKLGEWRGVLQLDSENELPFNFNFSFIDSGFTISVFNAEEKIVVDDVIYINDSLLIQMPFYQSEFALLNFGDSLKGYYYDKSRSEDYKIPFIAFHNEKYRFKPSSEKIIKYPTIRNFEVSFSPNTDNQYKAILNINNISPTRISANFETETGDYRYLEGIIDNGELKLSSFDGAHAFLFKGKLINIDSIYGRFWSGNHWKNNWSARRNDTFQLTNPYMLTNKTNEKVNFSFPDLENNLISLSDDKYKNKPVILQIMGSYCPNCLDESKYLSKIYNKYKVNGLEIISLAFERSTKGEQKGIREKVFENLRRYKKSIGINYEILLASMSKDKKEAIKQLPFLDKVLSYPTTVYLNRNHEVIKIHTGFYGPASGVKYNQFITENKLLLDKLLN